MPKISQLWIYPIKSLPGISLKQSKLLSKGLENDRKLMLVDSDNNFISQRKFSQMALFSVSIEEHGLKLTYKNMPTLIIPWVTMDRVNGDSATFAAIKVKIWQDECDALTISTTIDQWFSEALGIDCQLVYLADESQRFVDKNFAFNDQQTRFSDGFPLLLISEESLNDLNTRLHKPLSMQNFRPNIVVSDCSAYAEDNWKDFTIKKTQFSVVKPCSRCIITTIDPLTGIKSADREPLKTLALYRKKASQVFFGQNVLFKTKDFEILEIGNELVLI